MNSALTEKYTARGDKVHFQFQQEQELKISPEIIAEIDKKIIEKIKQRLNFRKDKFVQYYIDNCRSIYALYGYIRNEKGIS